MQITIDSNEPLSDVLKVIGSMYGVALATADPADTEDNTAQERHRTPRSRASNLTGRRRGKQKPTTTGLDARAVRQWAWENGHEVNARGALPGSVREAYEAANPR